MKNTLSFLVQTLLQKNKIKIDSEELDFQIQSHPSYPSLHAITGVLSHFDIDNIAVRVAVEKAILEELPTSFIGEIKMDDETDFALIINKGKNYKLVFSEKKSETISETNFLEVFTGVVVAAEKDETKKTNQINTPYFQRSLIVIALIVFAILFINSNPDLNTSIYLVLSLIGVGVSCLIIQHDLGFNSKIIDRICSQESKTTNCNAVLNSKGATLYKNIKLSDISLIYFVSISIASLLLALTKNSSNVMFLISLTALPVVIYSIYYQIKISKNWCVLCLSIALVLILQASMYFITKPDFSILAIKSILLVVFIFTLITSLWLFINPKLKQEQDFKKLKIKSTKFKRNFNLFNTLLKESKSINTKLVNTSEIVFGNKNAPLNITIITNPFCGHCKSVHNVIESILKQYHNKLNVTVRFNINTSNLESKGVLVSNRLLQLFHTKGEIKCIEAMHDIYNNGDTKSWLNKWRDCDTLINYIDILEAENKWCLNHNINFTPEILINGRSFPKTYDKSDLIYFIEELSEVHCANIKTTKLQLTI